METWSAEIENPRAGVDAARGSEPEDSMLAVHQDLVKLLVEFEHQQVARMVDV